MVSENLKRIQLQIDSTPPLSVTTSQLLATIGEPHHSLNDIVSIVETDAVLTSLVLKTVNSAAYSLGKEIETVVDAIRFLGDSVVAGLALKSEKSDIYNRDISGYLADSDANWAHSLKTAIASRYFAKLFTGGKVREAVAYTAGIVHDIGKTLLSELLTVEQEDLMKNREFIEMEKSIVGITHAEAGAMLAQKWKLPKAIQEVIQFHHEPQKANEEFRYLVYSVHLGDFASMMIGTGTGVDSMRHALDSSYVDYLPIGESELEKALFEIQLEFNITFDAIQSTFRNLGKEEEK